MPSTHPLHALIGNWSGTNQLSVMPGEPVRESDSIATVALELGNRVLEIRYTWADSGAPQEGWLLVQHDPGTGVASAAWTDTWHMAHGFLHLDGRLELDGRVNLLGNYPAPPGPDWGWRIEITPGVISQREFSFRMFNIEPQGPEQIAVDTTYRR
jgi:hypothetical protein